METEFNSGQVARAKNEQFFCEAAAILIAF